MELPISSLHASPARTDAGDDALASPTPSIPLPSGMRPVEKGGGGMIDEVSSRRSLEIGDSSSSEDGYESDGDDSSVGFNFLPTALPESATPLQMATAVISLLTSIPICLGFFVADHVTGRTWPATPLAFHWILTLLLGGRAVLPTWKKKKIGGEYGKVLHHDDEVEEILLSKPQESPKPAGFCRACPWSLMFVTILDTALFGLVYPIAIAGFSDQMLMDVDGTPVAEWTTLLTELSVVMAFGYLVVILRVGLALGILWVWIRMKRMESLNEIAEQIIIEPATMTVTFPSGVVANTFRAQYGPCLSKAHSILHTIALMSAFICILWSTISSLVHIPSWNPPANPSTPAESSSLSCDPLDLTECALPFPSSYHLVADKSTTSGWKVNLPLQSFLPLKGGLSMDLSFANELDGFGTMTPMMFYIDGMKEAYEANLTDVPRLQGATHISWSITNSSLTLLLDVTEKKLIPHIAEIDYLDPNHPLVLVTPFKPLNHASHYAVAIWGATDANGKLLPATPGFKELMTHVHKGGVTPGIMHELDRARRFKETILPSLQTAAPWVDYDSNPENMQLMFDFRTVSNESQLGRTKSVRRATLERVSDRSWEYDVKVIRQRDNECTWDEKKGYGYQVARTIHGEMNVPWFLQSYGPGARGETLDSQSLQEGKRALVGRAKFDVHVPCALRAAALGLNGRQALRAVVEYGHGIFGTRKEAQSSPVIKMGNENGYLVTAMDWRGMSIFDLPLVVKTMLSRPGMFSASRDNIIQGFANKIALTHYSQNGLLGEEFLRFGNDNDDRADDKSIPIMEQEQGGKGVVAAFYGASQGGILGAGYTALAGERSIDPSVAPGKLGMLDRSVLNVPGTPFSLVLTRSLDFRGYDALLLVNLYHNRHVRILMSVFQMAWDAVEASGLLAGERGGGKEKEGDSGAVVSVRGELEGSRGLAVPRVLLQAGLGDAEVPTITAEALSRAFNASTLPGNPREVYGLSTSPVPPSTSSGGDKVESDEFGPRATLTEILYQAEYQHLPRSKNSGWKYNNVHRCVRFDPALQEQASKFINTGRIIDPCAKDHCIRHRALC